MSEDNKTSVEINLDIESVFGFVSNAKNLVHFWPKAIEVDKLSGEGEVGSTYKVFFPTFFGRRSVEIEISKLAEPSEFAFINKSLSGNPVTGFKFGLLADKKTEVSMTRASSDPNVNKAVEGSGIAKLLEGRKSDKEFVKVLENLKTYLEKNNPQAQKEEAPEKKTAE